MKFDNFVNIYNFLILFGRSDRLRIVCYREFLVGRAIRRLGTGSDEVSTRSQKRKNPDNLSMFGDEEDYRGTIKTA